jgi:hypothetical protein
MIAHGRIRPGASYVALGSSYAAGAGLGPADPHDIGGWCGRTTIAYPYLLAEALGLELTNASCGGAKTENIAIVRQDIANENGSHTGDLQIDSVTAATELVTLTIGGNDVNYVGNLTAEACLGDLAADPTSPISNALKDYGVATPVPDQVVLAALARLEGDLVAAVEAVQAKAPRARIVLVDYLTVLPENGQACALAPIPQDRQRFLLGVASEMSLATRRAAEWTGAEFVAVSEESRDHHVCSSDPWVIG